MPGKHWTKAELAAKAKKQAEQQATLDNASAVAEGLEESESALSVVGEAADNLTDRQRVILRLRLRGMNQTSIGKALDISQPMVSKELTVIKEHLAERGQGLESQAKLGESFTVFEEVEYRAWELFHTNESNPSIKAKALDLVMSAREKNLKLMFDVGFIRKASQDHTHTIVHEVSPMLKQWDPEKKQQLAADVIEGQLSELDEPEPPKDEYDIEESD